MIDRNELVKWLKSIDKKLHSKITLIAVGGTAMTLLGLKSSTRDVDFCIKSDEKKDFEKALDKKFKVDIFIDGYIFSEQLPADYVEKSKEIVKMNNIALNADVFINKISPVFIVGNYPSYFGCSQKNIFGFFFLKKIFNRPLISQIKFGRSPDNNISETFIN